MSLQKPYREPSAAEILSMSLSVYWERLKYLVVPFLFANAANAVFGWLLEPYVPPLSIPQNFTEAFFLWLINYLATAIPVMAVLVVASWVTGTVANGIAVKYLSDLVEGRPAHLRTGFSLILTSIPSLLAVGLITGALVTLGSILFILPGIIAAIVFSLTVQVIVVERVGTYESLKRSRRLVAGRWGKAFTVLFSVFLATTFAYVIGDIVGSFIEGPLSPLKWIITIVVPSLAEPVHPVALTCLYYSLRAREKPPEPVIPFQLEAPVAPPSTRPPTSGFGVFQPRFCYKCGQRLPSEAIYCPRCGARVRP